MAVYNKIMTQARRTMLAMESQGDDAPQQSLETALQADGLTFQTKHCCFTCPGKLRQRCYFGNDLPAPLSPLYITGIILKEVDPAGMRFGPLKGISKRFER